MQVFGIIVKIVLALAAVAGIVYLAATYGDRVVAWAKGLLKGKCCCGGNCDCDCEDYNDCSSNHLTVLLEEDLCLRLCALEHLLLWCHYLFCHFVYVF